MFFYNSIIFVNRHSYVVDVIESDPTTRRLSETGNFLDDSGGGNNNGGLGLVLPDVIVTKRNRSDSVVGRIEDDVERGAVKYFCRSRGHGFIVPENVSQSESVLSRSWICGPETEQNFYSAFKQQNTLL